MLMRSPETLPTRDFGGIKKKMDQDYLNNISLWAMYWTQGNIAVRAEAGDESLMAQLGVNTGGNGRGNFYYNRIRPICNMLSGYQRENRKSVIVAPIEGGDQATADQFTKILLNIFKKENVQETISEAFHQGALITGLNLLQIYLDFSRDPVNGDIKVANKSYSEYMIDPYFRNVDLSDAQFIRLRTYMDPAAAAAIMPADVRDEVLGLPTNLSGLSRDGKFQYMPESFGYTQGNKLAYDEYYYRDYRVQKQLIDRQSGDVMDVSLDTDFEDRYDLRQFLNDNPQILLEEKTVPTVRMAIQIQDKVFYDGPQSIAGLDDFPFIPVIGFYNKNMPYMYSRIAGLVKSLIDPQMLLVRRINLSADYLESTVNTGWMFREGAPVDPKHLMQTGQGRIIPVKDEYQLTDIQPIQPPQIPPSFFQLQDTFDKEMYNCAGISQENLGKVISDDSSGFQSALRQKAGLMAQKPLFDRLDTSLRILGDKMIQIIQNNWTPAKVKKILGGEEPADLFYNKAFGKYHCQVELGFDTDTQKQMQFLQMLELRNAGIPISDEDMIEAATLQNKNRVLERMKQQQEQQAAMAEKQSESQNQLNLAQAKLANARAMADIGLYNERTSRVEENRAMAQQRMHEANMNDSKAMLDKVKALKELEDMDLNQLARLVELAQSLKEMENADAEIGQANEKSESIADMSAMGAQAQQMIAPDMGDKNPLASLGLQG